MKLFWTFVLVLLANAARCATYYVSASATAGDGSLVNPWSLSGALTNTAIAAGDTVYLRGGTFTGAGWRCTLSGNPSNYITITSAAGEWAKLQGGKAGTLSDSMSDSGGDTYQHGIIGSDNWYVGMVIIVGSETMQLNFRSGTNWTVVRGWDGSTISAHSAGDQVIPKKSVIEHSGSYVRFQDFEITTLAATNRVVHTSHYVSPGLNLTSEGVGNKAINLIIHNVGHPGIGFWNQQDGGEINGCIIFGCGVYDTDGTWVRGGGIYAQNNVGEVRIANNIFFRNLRAGCSIYGTEAFIRGFSFDHNFAFAPGTTGADSAQMLSDVSRMTNNTVGTNVIMGRLGLGYQAISNVNQRVIGNLIVNHGLSTEEFVSGVVSNNTLLLPWGSADNQSVSFSANGSANKAELDFIWDYNTYYFKNLTNHPYQFAYNTKDVAGLNGYGGGMLMYEGDGGKSWKDYSGFDEHSGYYTNWPTDYLNVSVNQLTYNTNRFYVCVVSTSGSETTTLDLSTLGFTTGAGWELRDAQNYFSVVSSGTYSGGAITLPLTLTNVADITGITNYVNKHTNVDAPGLFNTFVLTRTAGRFTHSHGSGTLGSSTR